VTNIDILDELRARGELVERLKRIAPRFREIINLRYGLSFETGLRVRGEMTIEQVAKLYSITNERLRQIEKKVFKELSEGLTDSPWHTGTPTEEGWYLVQHLTDAEYCGSKFFVARWDGEKFVINPRPPIVVTYPNGTAWRKIEDEEASNG